MISVRGWVITVGYLALFAASACGSSPQTVVEGLGGSDDVG